ncbi:hypothetical protein V5P93_000344 [Actinokineospora auranticolor]|uniref:DeoxyPurine in DNA protein A domain-containing protein n=1 Tax=Actinokineospora auranticolor TaxID=155976 RepID=A0A2S6GKM9_9PSEU|nr:hypothetical protein [Actinokineospora auranticolor]PPK65769.1 hypothetical protein CLV40_11228 [Actinokineospora auranticolor]
MGTITRLPTVLPKFLLGLHQPSDLPRAGVPAFVSDTRLRARKTLPRAAAPVAYDSGGFTQLQKHGAWTIGPREYIARLRRYRDEIGGMLWAAQQDWMCEPLIISGGRAGPNVFVGTGLSVPIHQRRTVDNLIEMRALAPDLWIVPSLQGWEVDDYLRCRDLYDRAGIDLTAEPLVGLGSVCRRQGTKEAGQILRVLHTEGITRIHGFGFKTLGLIEHGHLLTSSDSLAWSYDARQLRRLSGLPDCPGTHKNCANCLPYALHWRARVLAAATTNTTTTWEAVA